MAILLENEHGWLICSKTYFDRIYKDAVPSIKIRKEFFEINTPLLMNSAAVKKSKSQCKTKTRHKKIPEISYSQAELRIKEAKISLVKGGKLLQHFKDTPVKPEEWLQNNSVAKVAANEVPELTIDASSVLYYENIESTPVVQSFGSAEYILPPHSSFLLADISHLHLLAGRKYDLIVMDPPWRNKSIRRKKKYRMLECEDLVSLPIGSLLAEGGLVAVWATANQRQISFVKEELLKRWGLPCHTHWHWLKVTRRGEYVHPLPSPHRKPYESLVVGHSRPLPPHRVLLSVPSSIHSQKPPLVDLLAPFLPPHPACLELFARYLLPHWTSVGNQVLKLQNVALFDKG